MYFQIVLKFGRSIVRSSCLLSAPRRRRRHDDGIIDDAGDSDGSAADCGILHLLKLQRSAGRCAAVGGVVTDTVSVISVPGRLEFNVCRSISDYQTEANIP